MPRKPSKLKPPADTPALPMPSSCLTNPHRFARRFAKLHPDLRYVAGKFYAPVSFLAHEPNLRCALSLFLDHEFRRFQKRTNSPDVPPVTRRLVDDTLDALRAVCFGRVVRAQRREAKAVQA